MLFYVSQNASLFGRRNRGDTIRFNGVWADQPADRVIKLMTTGHSLRRYILARPLFWDLTQTCCSFDLRGELGSLL